MSREFDSLRETSQLPEWLTDEAMLSDYWLLEMGGTHGDEQAQVEYVRGHIENNLRLPGFLPIIANRKASDAQVRSMAAKQLMGWYPGDFDGETNEARTAAGITWLSSQLSDNHVVIDRHDSSQGQRYMSMGVKVTPAALAAGFILGHRALEFTTWSTFCKVVPKGLAIEEPVPPNEQARTAYVDETDRRLKLISDLGYEGLKSYYYEHSVADQLIVFEKIREVNLVNPGTGEPDKQVLDILPELEAADSELPDGWGTEMPLSAKAREVLGLDPSVGYYRTEGGYRNWSAMVDNKSLGIPDDVQRRIGWSAILAKRSAPKALPGTDFLVFK